MNLKRERRNSPYGSLRVSNLLLRTLRGKMERSAVTLCISGKSSTLSRNRKKYSFKIVTVCTYGHPYKVAGPACYRRAGTSIPLSSESRELETIVPEMKKKSLLIFNKKEPFMDITVFQMEHTKSFVIVQI